MEKVQRAYGNRLLYIKIDFDLILKDMGLGEIYKITCNITNKSYIGQAVSNYVSGQEHGTEHRWKIHVWDSKREKPRCKALASAIVKYGEHN